MILPYQCSMCGDKNVLDSLYSPFICSKCNKEMIVMDIPDRQLKPISSGNHERAQMHIRLGTDLKQWQWTGKRWKKTI